MTTSLQKLLNTIEGFDWDEANQDKNWLKHEVTKEESEQIFFNTPVVFFEDQVHSGTEERYGVLGKTNLNRKISAAFTIRNNKIRAISARDQSKKERQIYLNMENKK